jgi:hypothetical protein
MCDCLKVYYSICRALKIPLIKIAMPTKVYQATQGPLLKQVGQWGGIHGSWFTVLVCVEFVHLDD